MAELLLVAEHREAPEDSDSGGIERYDDHALLAETHGLRVRLPHHHEDPAIRV
jgi:hypothetical protein